MSKATRFQSVILGVCLTFLARDLLARELLVHQVAPREVAPDQVAASRADESGVSHVVLAWFKPGTSAAYVAQVEAQSQVLRQIPEVREIRTGAAIPSDRPVVDTSYDLAIYVYFDSAEDLQRYLVHPTHTEFVKLWVKPQLERMQIYDFRAR